MGEKRLSARELKKKKLEEALEKSKGANKGRKTASAKPEKTPVAPNAPVVDPEPSFDSNIPDTTKTEDLNSPDNEGNKNNSGNESGSGSEEDIDSKQDVGQGKNNEPNTGDLSDSNAGGGDNTKTLAAAQSDALLDLENSFTGQEENYTGSFKNGDKLLAFLRYKNRLISDQDTVTTKIPEPVSSDYAFVSEVISRVTGTKLSKQEVIGEALIRYFRDVIEKDPIYKKALKAYNEMTKGGKKGLY